MKEWVWRFQMWEDEMMVSLVLDFWEFRIWKGDDEDKVQWCERSIGAWSMRTKMSLWEGFDGEDRFDEEEERLWEERFWIWSGVMRLWEGSMRWEERETKKS